MQLLGIKYQNFDKVMNPMFFPMCEPDESQTTSPDFLVNVGESAWCFQNNSYSQVYT